MKKSNPLEKRASEIFSEGGNVSSTLRKELGEETNTENIIEAAYNQQAGSYVSALSDETFAELKCKTAGQACEILRGLGSFDSCCEAGVGEATTMRHVMAAQPNARWFGFDISLPRLAVAQQYLREHELDATLFRASLGDIPMLENEWDLVYTYHSMEPNGGREKLILAELARVSRKYLVLFEPGYEFASPEAKARMEEHAYVRGLAEAAAELDLNVLRHEAMPASINPMNPTAVTVIKCF